MNLNIPINGSADIIVLLLVFIALLFGSRAFLRFFRNPQAGEKKRNRRATDRKQIVLSIDGMMCGQCEAHVKEAIRKNVPKAKGLRADHMEGRAVFSLEEEMPSTELRRTLEEAFEPMGYRLLDLRMDEGSR